ncbi:MAG: hypothetical protein KDA22_12185, partial [Phycisphaerales bacterium]|nr:hypothetical protein [Phycisphaerales bacterium]
MHGKNTIRWIAAGIGLAALAAPALACDALVISEIRIDEPGLDNNEYFELYGPPNFSLEGIWYIVIGDAEGVVPPGQNGTIEYALDLSGNSTDAEGLFLVAKNTFTLGTPDLVAALNFENNDNVTHLLVANFVGSDGQDLDTNDDGVLDVEPWSGVLCSVALVNNLTPDGITSDFYYPLNDNVVGPDAGLTPAQAWRCSDTDEWQIGSFTVGLTDTPGELNPKCAAPVAVAINELRIDQAAPITNLYTELVAAPGTSLFGLTYIVLGDGPDGTNSGVIEEAISLDGSTVGESGYFVIAADDDTFGYLADLIVPLNFENSDNVTHMIVQGFTGAVGDDADTNDDGVLDAIPWTTTIDSIALVETPNPPTVSGNEWYYGTATVGPDGPFVPAHAYRCSPDGIWTIGSFDAAFGNDTPGAENAACMLCGNAGSGGCFVANGIPGCEDVACCEAVCDIDPACCQTGWDQGCVDEAFAQCLSGGRAPDVTLSEIRIDQPSVDFDEYAELAAAPGTSLDGVSYIVLGDGSGGSGTIESVTNLTGQTVGASGFFVIAESTFTLGTADLVADLNFENSDNVSHFLVFNFTGAENQDLDTDDDGVLDVTPWQSVIDAVALVEPAVPPADPGAEWPYGGTVVGPDGNFVPGHVYRCDPDGTWTIGPFDPLGGLDTPGATNAPCGAVDPCGQPDAGSCLEANGTPGCDDATCCQAVCDIVPICCEVGWDAACAAEAESLCQGGGEAPDVLISEIRIDQPGTDNDEYFEL